MQDNNLLCPSCRSENVYFSRKKGFYICEDCDETFNYTEQQQKGKNLFFSYGHDKNAKIVNKIKADLEERGFTVWIDHERINTGDNWRKKISQSIADSSLVLAFLSSHSMRDESVCRDELRIALCEKCGYIQPILLESTDKFSPPQNLTEVQWVDMSEWESYDQSSTEFDLWYRDKLLQLLSVLESNETLELSGDITTLKSAFKPKLLSVKESTLLKKEFYGREWLFDEICNTNDARIIQIRGGAGSGKSAISARLQYHLPSVVGCWYCSWNDALSIDVREFLKTFVFKLAVSISEYRRYIVSRIDDLAAVLEQGNTGEIIDKLIHLPMQYVIDGGREDKYFIVDGIDESLVKGKSEIAQVLRALSEIMPPWFKFIVTTRPEREILSVFGTLKVNEIDLDSDEKSHGDLDFYMEQKGLDKSSLSAAVGQNFLLLELIANSGGKDLELSCGLSDYYSAAFDRIFGRREYTSCERVALSILINCVAPITDDVLLQAFNKKARDYTGFIRSLREFLSFGAERFRVFWSLRTVTLFHYSFREWLTSDDAGIFKIELDESVETALEFYNKILSEDSADATLSFIRNYELFLAKNNRFDILSELRKDERYELIKQRISLDEDYSNKQNSVAHLDSVKIAKIEELSHKISLLSKPIRYHYAKPLSHHGGGAMDDYCDYYIFPCCNHMQACEGAPHTVTESGCRAHYGDISTLPECITLTPYDEFQFWRKQLDDEYASSDRVYQQIYRSIYANTTGSGKFDSLSSEDREFVLRMIENTAKTSFSVTMRHKTEEIVRKLRYLKDRANISDEEFDEILSGTEEDTGDLLFID